MPAQQKLYKIIFIAAEGKATWIGSEKGLRDNYPFAKIIKKEIFKGFES